jgi:BirA family transcriptional regulator, biotin operon repressor / biotin---[acetyl-CoA-carboxylase] ligase
VPETVSYDGLSAAELRTLLDLPRVELLDSTPSTQDVANALGAEGAAAGTLVLADAQSAGRGRGGRVWVSAAGEGIWLTLLERPTDVSAFEVLSLRLGLKAAAALDRFTPHGVRLKWPNDLYTRDGKLGGVLVEARWRDGRPEWVAIGFGLNVTPPPGVANAGALSADTRRVEVLAELVPALRAAAAARGSLTDREIEAFAQRDLARGCACLEPGAGIVDGISSRGELLVRATGGLSRYHHGSLVLA